MALLVRTLLIWLLALAVPAQGAAAASMAYCGPEHPGVAAAASPVEVRSSDHVHRGLVASAAAADHEHAPVDAGTPTANAAGIDGATGATTADAHSCNVCGSCCSAGALLGTAPGLPVADAAATAFSPVGASVDPFAADGLDRPPRHPRA